MKKLDWYIVRKFIGTFFYAIGILAVVACVIDYSEKVRDFIEKKAPFTAVLGYYGTFIPHIVALLFPLFIFIAVIFFTSRLAYKSEIIVMLATGMSFTRFLRPYLIGGIFLGLLFLFANHLLIPMADKYRLDFENHYYHEKVLASDKDVHLQLSKDLLIYVHGYDYTNNTGTKFTAERIDGTLLKEKTFAETISYDSTKKLWKLRQVTIRTNDGMQESLVTRPEILRQYPFTPKDLRDDAAIKEGLTTPQLTKYIEEQTLRGNENLNVYALEKQRRTAAPFAAIILTVIGACIASRKVRGGSGVHLAVGVILCSGYMLALQFTNTFSTNAGLNPFIALWIPNALFGLLALGLYLRQIR